jgi:hypothetical protein
VRRESKSGGGGGGSRQAAVKTPIGKKESNKKETKTNLLVYNKQRNEKENESG